MGDQVLTLSSNYLQSVVQRVVLRRVDCPVCSIVLCMERSEKSWENGAKKPQLLLPSFNLDFTCNDPCRSSMVLLGDGFNTTPLSCIRNQVHVFSLFTPPTTVNSFVCDPGGLSLLCSDYHRPPGVSASGPATDGLWLSASAGYNGSPHTGTMVDKEGSGRNVSRCLYGHP